MSERRKKGANTSKMIAYIGAGLLHALIIGVLLFNITFKDDSERVDAFDAEKIDIVKARAVDEDQLQKTRDEIRKKEQAKKRQREREEKRLRDLKKKADREKKRLAELEKQKKAAEEAERQRVIALNKKKQKEKELAEKKRKEQEQREAEKKRKEKAERDAEAERRRRESEELTKRLLAEEEQRRAAAEQRAAAERTTTAQSRAVARIGIKISQAFRVDPSLPKNLVSVVSIKVSPSGEVESVRTIESSGDASFDRSGERAVLLASPLPIPTEEEDLVARARFLEQEFEFELFHPFARR